MGGIIPPEKWVPPKQKKQLSGGPEGPELDLIKPEIDPVPCGKPPKVDNSIYPDAEKVFPESAKYNCHNGYTVDGTSNGDTKPTIVCGKDGEFLYKEKTAPCLNVCPWSAESHLRKTMPNW